MKCEVCLNSGEIQEDEDYTLQLNVTERHYQKFNISEDGTLEYIDSDADQDIYLECPVCGTKYEFDVDEDNFILQVEERFVVTKFNLNNHNSNERPIVNLNNFPITVKRF